MANGAQAEGIRGLVGSAKSLPLRVSDYIGEIRGELRRVSWPSRQEVYGTTVVVIITVFVFGVYFFLVDRTLLFSVNRLLEWLRNLV